jgi:hypothetical protein
MSNPASLKLIQKGERRGSRKGIPNKYTRLLKHALILAAEKSKHSLNRGKSLEGYCTYLADEKQELFVHMLGRLIPEQAKADMRDVSPMRDVTLNINMPVSQMVNMFEQRVKGTYVPNQPPPLIEYEDAGSDD